MRHNADKGFGNTGSSPGFARWFALVVIFILVLGVGGVWVLAAHSGKQAANNDVTRSSDKDSSFSELTVAGPLHVEGALLLTPQSEPVQPAAGQLYFDQATKRLTYYDGSSFVALQGDRTTGVQSITAGSSNVTVTDNGSGAVTIAVSSASGGTLATPVIVAKGGTGATAFSANGVVLGNGTAALTAAVAGSAGLCLVSTAGAPAFAACPGASGNPFVQNGNSFGATAVLGTNDANGLSFETNNATQASIAVGGAVTFKNSADSSSAFQILNSGTVPEFVIDTAGSKVYVGNPSGDTTGALLVLDSKTSGGDPAGVDGAMYYNSALAVMRCYMDGYWRDCTNNERTGYTYVNDMVADHDSEVAFSGTYFAVAGSYDGHPGVVDLHAANSGDISGVHSNLTLRMGGGTTWRHETDLRVGSLLSDVTDRYVIATGFADTFSGDITAISNGCYFRYSDNVNAGKWQGVCETGSVESVCDTGLAVAASTWYRLTVVVNDVGTAANFTVDGANACQVTSNIPTGSNTTNFKTLVNKTTGTNNRITTIDYVSIRAQFDTPR